MSFPPRYIGPFEILQKIGEVAYKLALPPQLLGIHDVFHVSMLRKYEPDTNHVLDWHDLNLQEDETYEERLREILDKKEQQNHTFSESVMGSSRSGRSYMGVGIKYEKQVPRILYRFASLNFKDKIFIRGRELSSRPRVIHVIHNPEPFISSSP